MGNGPDFSASRYGIVGDGRLARHIACYFSLSRIHYRQWSRRTSLGPARYLSGCEVVLVLISDDAIEGFIKEHFSKSRQTLAHCSGALSTPLAVGVHPLMSFGPELMTLEQYRAIPFVMEKGEPRFAQLFPELKNPCYLIPKGTRPLYHSLAVMAGNFSVLLWQKLFSEYERLGLPKQAALPYLRTVFANLEADPASALTGPLQRGDRATIARNIKALKGDPFAKVYKAFTETIDEDR